MSSTTSSVTRDFVRDGAEVADPVLSDGDAVYTSGISERRGSATTYQLPGLKNVDAQANASQVITSTRQYDAFGNVVSQSGTWAGPFAYAGGFGYQEDSTGFMLLGHRLLDPSTGRFLTRDPIQDGRNWYVYCEGNPVNSADLWGLDRVIIVVGGPGQKRNGQPDAAYPWFGQELELNRRKYVKAGHVVTILDQPTEKRLQQELAGADGLVFIGHGSPREPYGRLRGPQTGEAKERLTPGLIQRARGGKKLKFAVLETCHQGRSEFRRQWLKVTTELYAYPAQSHSDHRIRDWGKPDGYGPNRYK